MTRLDQSVLDQYRQSLAAKQPHRDTGQGFVGDVVDATQKGAYDGVAGIGETFGLDSVRDWGQEGAADQIATMSDAGKAALNKQFFTEQNNTISAGEAWTDPRAVAMQIGHVIGLNADILAGGAVVKGGSLAVTQVAKLARNKVLSKNGSQEMAEMAAQKATETFLQRQVGDKAAQMAGFAKDTLAYGAAGHAVGAGLQAIDLGNEVEALDFEELEQLPEYQQIVRQNAQAMGGASALDVLSTSRTQLAEQARTAIKTNPTLLTSNLLIGGLGTAALSRILSGAMPRGAGVATEFAVEGAQGGMEQIAGNQVRQDYVDPNQDIGEGVTASALNEAMLGGAVGAAASAVPKVVDAGRAWLGKTKPVAADPALDVATDPTAVIPSASPEMGPPAYPDLANEFEAPTLDPVVNPSQNSQSQFYSMASEAAKTHPEFIDGLVNIVAENPERAKAAISVLDKFMVSDSYRKNAEARLAQYLGADPGSTAPEVPAADAQAVAQQDADDFAHLVGVVRKENADFAQQLQNYVQQKPEKIGVAIDTAARYITDPAWRPNAEQQLNKFLSRAAAPVEAAKPMPVQAEGNTNVLPEQPVSPAIKAAQDFVASYPIDKRGTIDPELLRDTFDLNDQQIAEVMPWKAADKLSTETVGNAENNSNISTVIEQAASQAATSPLNDLPEPTPAQKEAGNYRKGHVSVHGLDIAIENAKGSERKGTDEKGKAWSVKMADHYGYIKRSEGADGDHVDVFIGENPDSRKVFIVDQVNKDGSFDEHKVILGAVDAADAEKTYKRNYSAGWAVGPISEMDIDQFKDWLKNGDTKAPLTKREQWEPVVADFGALRIERYSEKSVVVRGDTKPYKDALKNLKGTFNPRLKGGEGWIYSTSRIDELKKALPSILQREQASTDNQKLSAAAEADKPALFQAAKTQLETLASRAQKHDEALAKRITDVLPGSMPASFDAGRVQAEIAKYEKQVALHEKREAIQQPQAVADAAPKQAGANLAGSKTPVAKTGDVLKDYWANSASESVKNTPPVNVNIDEQPTDVASDTEGEARRLDNATAPEHVTTGVDDRELAEIVEGFKNYMEGNWDHGESLYEEGHSVTNIFVQPKKSEVVRLEQKAKVYHKDHGWMTPAEARKKIDEWKQHAANQYDNEKIRGANSDKVVLSLFDKSGQWSQPWEDAGYQVYRFDIQNDEELGDVNNFSTEFFNDWFGQFEGQEVYAILAACPCTDFASSGARHFAAKDEDGRTISSVKLVHQTLRTIEFFKPAVWALENPVGRIEKLGGLPNWRLSFDPNHVGDPYTKKTLIWGRFNADLPIAPVDPVEGSKMHTKYGGKSMATKNARSVTPEGFAYSFFMANNAADHPVMAFANEYDRLDRSLIEKAIEAGIPEREIRYAIDDFYYMDLDDDAANAAIQELIDDLSPNDPVRYATSEEDSIIIAPSNERMAADRLQSFVEKAQSAVPAERERYLSDIAYVLNIAKKKAQETKTERYSRMAESVARYTALIAKDETALAAEIGNDAAVKAFIASAGITGFAQTKAGRLKKIIDWRDKATERLFKLIDAREVYRGVALQIGKEGAVEVSQLQQMQGVPLPGGLAVDELTTIYQPYDYIIAADLGWESVLPKGKRAPAEQAILDKVAALKENPASVLDDIAASTVMASIAQAKEVRPHRIDDTMLTNGLTPSMAAAIGLPKELDGLVAKLLRHAYRNGYAPKGQKAEAAPAKVSTNKIFTDDAAEKARALLRSKLGQLNSGIDPEILQAGLTLAGWHVEKGARSFAQFVTAMVDDMGASVRPYLKSWYMAVKYDPRAADFDGMSSSAEVEAFDLNGNEAESTQGKSGLADVLLDKLDQIQDNRKLKAVVAEYHGIAPAGVTAEMMKDAQEAMELALVSRAREVVANGGADREVYDRLVELYQNQPNLNVRSSTSMENMAYSTPAPLAFITGRLAGVTEASTVYEPTAGNGMLLITANIDNAQVNELDPRRAEQLRQQGLQVTTEDAAEFIPADKFDVALMNPPFGRMDAPVKVEGYTIKAIDHLITIKALEAMKDDGKATIIIGASKEAGEIGASDRVFFNYLYSNYNVVDHFEVDGDLYRRQGAGWPVRVIVVHGRETSKKLSPKSGSIERIESWEQLYERYLESMDAAGAGADAIGAAGADGAVSGLQRNDRSTTGREVNSEAGAAGQRGAGRTSAGGSNAVAGARAGQRTGRAGAASDSAAADGNRELEPALQSGAVRQETGAAAGRKSAVSEANAANATGGLGQSRTDGGVDSGSSFQAVYPALSKGFNDGALTPVNMAQASQRAMQKMVAEIGDVDSYVTAKLGYNSVAETHKAFMALQVDTVAAAIYNAENKNKGIIIADQTGVGKGRQAAGIIRYAIKQGKTPIFITVTDNLFTDMYNDLIDIGSDDAAPLIVNQDGFIKAGEAKIFKTKSRQAHLKTIDDIISSGKLPADHNVLFLTYSQLDGDRQRRLINALKGNAIFVLDEAHNAAGIREKKADGKVTLTRAGFIYESIANAPVTYLSATYAKRPDNLPVFYRTDLMDAVDKVEDLVDAVAAGGEPLQTLIAGQLAESGQLYRRERSFEGIKIDTLVDYENEAAHEELADRVTEGLRAIVDADEAFHNLAVDVLAEQYQDEGGSARGAGNRASSSVEHSNFTSIVHNFISQLLIGLKVKATVDQAVALKKAGVKPVIALQNTMGAFLNGFVADNGLEVGDPIRADYRDVLLKALDRTRRISVTDSGGNVKAVDVPLASLPSDVQQMYAEAKSIIEELDLSSIPLSPIDYVRDELEKAGIRTSEITGRGYRIDYRSKVPTLALRSAEEQNDKRGTVDAFNDGRLDALILNVAGSTGLSIHAAEKFKDQSPRHMIVMQAMADINILMQMLGRINRTGQVELPTYSMLSLAIPAEKRPAARTSKKFKSLNAQTSANTDSDVNLKAQDMMNKYGDKVMTDYLRENPEIAHALSLGVPVGGSVYPALYERATGRMALLPVKQQKEIYAELEAEYADLIEYLDKTGQNDLEPKTMDLDAKIISSKVVYEGKYPGTVFGGHTFLHQVDAKYQGKPPTADEVIKAIAKVKEPQAQVDSIIASKASDKGYHDKLREALEKAQVEQKKAEAKAEGKSDSKLNSKLIEATAAVSRAEEALGKYDASVRVVEDALSKFSVGHHFSIQLPEETVNAVVVAVKDSHRTGKGNPYSPSKVKFTFMVDSGIRQIDLTVSQLTGPEALGAIKTSKPNEARIHDVFKPVAKGAERREIRYIATGNAIMGSKKLGGRIISFTDHKGGVHQGILMPKNFRDEQFASADSGTDFALRDMAVLEKFLKDNRPLLKALGVSDSSGSIRLLPLRDSEWKIEIPKANKNQAVKDVKFSEALRSAMGAEFYGAGNTMTATFDDKKLRGVLPELDKLVQLRGLQSYRDAWVKAGGNALPNAGASFDGKEDKSGVVDIPAQLGNIVRSNAVAVPSSSEVNPRITVAKARMFAKAFDGRLADSGGGTFVAENFAEFPENIQAIASKDAHGFLYQGRVYVNLEHIRDLPSLQELLVHERLRHYGIRKLFGKDFVEQLNKIALQLGHKKLKILAEKYSMDYQGYMEYYASAGDSHILAALLDEVLAHIKESDVPTGTWAAIRRLLAQLKQQLRDWGMDALVNKFTSVNEHDLFLLIRRAEKAVKTEPNNNPRTYDSDIPAKLAETGNKIVDAVSQINAERMARWAEVFKPTKLWQAVKTKWPDWRPAMLQLLPRNYLADIGGDVLPSLRRYNNQVAAMEAQRNNLLNLTHETADKWRKLVGKDVAASKRLADLMHEATLIGVDPSLDKFYPSITRQTYQLLMSRAKAFIKSRNGEAEAVARGLQRRARIQAAMDKVPTQEAAYEGLRADFLALPVEYQQMFVEVRDSYLEMNRARKEALEKRIEDLITDRRVAAAQISMMREEFELNELSGIYFPLQRFGKYRAVVKDTETGEVHAYSMFETNADMQQWMIEQQGEGLRVEGGYQFEYSKMMDGVSAGFMKDLLLKFSPVFSQNSKIQDELYQLYLEHSPELSVRKHMIHRKGVSGYDQDALRAFAHNQFHTAYQIAKVSHTHHMQSHILAMEDEARALANTDDKVRAVQVVNELQQRNEWILNPKGSEWANKLTGFGFFWYLGTTPAAALVNITQTAMVGLPVLGARYTYKEAGSALAAMSAAFMKGKGNVDKTLSGRELAAFRELEKSGIIDKTMAHDMTGIADGGVAYSPRYHQVMKVAGFMFHHAERFNREVTSMAAYKLAYAKALKAHAGKQTAELIAHRDAIAEAIEMTKLSHFDYANSNRPRFMQGDMARVLLLFRQHSVNMTYRLIRDFQQSFWGRGEEKAIAQKQLAGMLGMTLLFAGAAGLPLYSVIAGIFNTMLDDEDEPFDFDAAVRENLADAIGETAAGVIMGGVPGNVVGADLTNRIGMNNLWFRDAEADVEGEAAVQYYAEQALGPMYGILSGWGKAAQLAREGHTGRAWESAVPKFARDWFKSARYADEGVMTKRGDPILDELSVWQIALQANGFTPLEVSEQYGKNNALSGAARRIADRRKLLLNRYALAKRNMDDSLVSQVLDDIERFNELQPTMKITAAHRVKSLVQRKKLSENAVNGVILPKKLAHLGEE